MDRAIEHSGGSFEFGRTHRAVLRRAGFENITASASYDSFGTPERMQKWVAYCRYFLLELHAELIVDQGWASAAELDKMAQAFQDWGSDPDAFFARCRCEAIGWKPENSVGD